MLVLVFYLCPSSVRVVATFSGTVLFPLLCSVLPFSPQYIDSFLYPILLSLVSVSKIVVRLFSSVPRLHLQNSMLL